MPLRATIVVPTRAASASDARMVEETVTSLREQSVPRDSYEIVVVDDSSDERFALGEDVILLRHDTPLGANEARNTGARAACADLLVFVDDDIFAPPPWLEQLLDSVARHPEVELFAGRVLMRIEGRSRYCDGLSLNAQGESELDLGDAERPVDYVVGANFAIRREAFGRAGGFSPEAPLYYDETELVERLRTSGASILYVPAPVWHRRRPADLRLSSLVKRSFKLGYGEAFFRAARGDGHSIHELLRLAAGIPGMLLHSVRHRCYFGVTSTASTVGKVWWRVTSCRRPPRRPKGTR